MASKPSTALEPSNVVVLDKNTLDLLVDLCRHVARTKDDAGKIAETILSRLGY